MRTIGMLVLVIGLWTQPLRAQILVYDAASHATEILNGIQIAITSAQSILQTGYMIIDLTAIDGALGTAEYLEDLRTMMALINDARALAWDFQSIAMQVERLFSLADAPDNTRDLSRRQIEIDQTLWQVYSYATAVQTLTRTILHTIDHLRQFWDRIGALIGNRQALQSINEEAAKLTQVAEKQAMMTASFQQAEAYQRLQEPLTRESIRRINTAIMADWPTAAR